MIINTTANEIYDLFLSEIDNQNARKKQGKDRSNCDNQIKKCNFILNLLDSVDGNTILKIENCWGDGTVRDFFLANAGSVVECLVNYHLTHGKLAEYSKQFSDDVSDAMNGCMQWEIKASITCKYLATPSKDRLTLLVNSDGVSLIKKCDVQSICKLNAKSHQDKLPCKGLYGNRNNFMVKFLSECFGFDN